MTKTPLLSAKEIVKILERLGFEFKRQKGSHRIYMKNDKRIVIPFHKGKILHPKIVKQVMKAIS